MMLVNESDADATPRKPSRQARCNQSGRAKSAAQARAGQRSLDDESEGRGFQLLAGCGQFGGIDRESQGAQAANPVWHWLCTAFEKYLR